MFEITFAIGSWSSHLGITRTKNLYIYMYATLWNLHNH